MAVVPFSRFFVVCFFPKNGRLKITYEAEVTVPAWATCLMSALQSAEPRAAEEDAGKRTFSWKQTVPMPSYLIAVAVGELESREISPRCVCACCVSQQLYAYVNVNRPPIQKTQEQYQTCTALTNYSRLVSHGGMVVKNSDTSN